MPQLHFATNVHILWTKDNEKFCAQLMIQRKVLAEREKSKLSCSGDGTLSPATCTAHFFIFYFNPRALA
jgi:hypothetical protein